MRSPPVAVWGFYGMVNWYRHPGRAASIRGRVDGLKAANEREGFRMA